MTSLTDTTIQDYQLEQWINRAEASIDAYMGFSLRQPNGFSPGILGIEQSGFDFSSRKCTLPMPPVPVRNITRVRIHISNIGSSLPFSGQPATSQGLYAILDPGEFIIVNDEGYGEMIALTLTYSLSSVVWELGMNPPVLELDLEIGYYLPFQGRTLYNPTNDNLLYRANQGFWASTYTQAPSILPNQLPQVPPVIYKNGVPMNATLLTTALVAGVAVTSLSVAPLLSAVTTGQVFTLNASTGLVPGSTIPALTVTASGPAAAGATILPINSVTPLVNYPAAAIPNWYGANMTTQDLRWGGFLNGTYITQGCSINYDEGTVSFYNSGTPSSPVANAATDVIQADYTATIPGLVHEAVIAQVTYLIQQSKLSQLGAGGLELVRSGVQEIRRARTDDTMEDALCAKARLKLARYTSIGIG